VGAPCPRVFHVIVQLVKATSLQLSLVFALACSAEPASPLPVGWELAREISDFTQGACLDDGSQEPGSIGVFIQNATAFVTWARVSFRCDQPLTAYARFGTMIDVLVQPVDLHPDAPARCDCLYTLDFAFEVDSDVERFNFYIRHDEHAGPTLPELTGTIVVP
jgi:hypothetical protein